MPHVIVKLWPGRPDEIKRNLADKLAIDVATGLSVDVGEVSVAFEEIAQEDWGREVFKKDICDKKDILYKKPDYSYDVEIYEE